MKSVARFGAKYAHEWTVFYRSAKTAFHPMLAFGSIGSYPLPGIQLTSTTKIAMPTHSRLGKQIAEVTAALKELGAQYALIGGLALASHKVIRATQDVDLLVASERADNVDAALLSLGYQCLHRSADAGNYQRGRERVDFLYASRPIARQLLAGAATLNTSLGELRVISSEGLIGFKLQGWVNDPRRTQDLEDIRALLRANREQLDLLEVRSYFQLFDRNALLDELLTQLG